MTVKVDVETIDPIKRRLAIEVPAEEVSSELDAEYARLARTARIPGFRPGRAPRHVLRQMFGDRIRSDVFDRLIQRSLIEAIEKEGIEVVGRPDLVTQSAQPGEPLRYNATVEVKPDIVLADLTGIELERPIHAIGEADIDQYLKRLRETMAHLHPVTDRSTVNVGDVVRVDYEARIDGKVIASAEGRDIEIGANRFPATFDQNLTGASVGSELEFDLAYAEESAAGPLAGKTVRFKVRVGGISTKDLPALDDEFAKDHGECTTLLELRDRIRTQLAEQARARGDEEIRRALLVRLVEANDLHVPRALIEHRLNALIEETRLEWERLGRWPRQDAGLRERLRQELGPQAIFEVKVGLLLEAVARREGITVSDSEIEERIAAFAEQADQARERVKGLYAAPEARQQLRTRMVQSRAVDLILQRVKIRDVEKSSVADPTETG
jgi:trigger factor